MASTQLVPPRNNIHQQQQQLRKPQVPVITRHECQLRRSSMRQDYGFDFKVVHAHNAILIGNVQRDSIAYKADLRDNDCVVEINGKDVMKKGFKLDKVMKLMEKCDLQIDLVLSRGHDYKFSEIVYRFIELTDANASLGFDLRCDSNNVFYIGQVITKSPSHKAGLQEGEILVEVNGIDIRKYSFDKLKEFIGNSKKSKAIMLGVNQY